VIHNDMPAPPAAILPDPAPRRGDSIVTRLTVAAVLLLALTACGFHPRTHTVLPIRLGPTRVVVADTFSPLGDELARALDRAGVPAADATDTNASVLRVTSESWQTRAVAVDQFARHPQLHGRPDAPAPAFPPPSFVPRGGHVSFDNIKDPTK